MEKFGCSLCTDAPLPSEKIGDDGESQTSLSSIFFWGEGDVCTQTIRLKFKREKINASSQVLNSLSSTSLNSFQRELFTCLFQRLLRLNRMAKFYPPNWIWKNHLRQRSTKGNRLGARKNLNSSRPLGRQLSPFTCPGPHLACLRLSDGSDDGARKSKSWLGQWQSGKVGTGNRNKSFSRAFPLSTDVSILLLNQPNGDLVGGWLAWTLAHWASAL